MTQNVRGLPDTSRDAYGTTGYHADSLDYDHNGNVAAITDGATGRNQRGNRTMTYDGLDRLKTVVSPMYGTTGATYTYDVLDNLTRVTIGGTSARDHHYCYDASWRLTNLKTGSCTGTTVVGLGYDVQGNLQNKNGRTFEFDYGNRLRSVAADTATGAPASTYVYDAHGRRVRDRVPTSKHSHYLQNGQLSMTSDGRRNIVAEYIYLAGSLIAIRERDTVTNVYTTKYQHTDALGSPVVVTDQNRTVLERSEYEPYGNVLSPANPIDGPGYTGHVYDSATGLNYMQQRYYDPLIGRFLSRDPVMANANTGGNFNAYWYAANNPYRFVDPDGRKQRDKRSLNSHSSNRGGVGTVGPVAFASSKSAAAQQPSAQRYGRQQHPSDPSWTREEEVRDQMEDAWRDSNPDSPSVPKGSPGSKKREQGGWVVQFFGEKRPQLVRSSPGSRDQMGEDTLHKPSEFECACRVLGFFHTHPNTRDEGYMPNANIFDYDFQVQMEVPGMIRNEDGYEFIPIPEGR